MPMPVGIWSLCLIALMAGCAGADESPGEGSPGQGSPGQGSHAPPPFPGSVAATSWRTTEDPPEGFGLTGDRFDSPFAALRALMTFGVQQDGGLPEGTRLVGDILDGDAATARAWMQLIGNADDSVAGSEFLLVMTKDAEGWFIESMAYRDHCRRGVDVAGELCV